MIEIVGHRGAAALVPENTLPSFEQAIALGCDATECDVHLTRDGHLVVCHDETVDRTTNGTGRIADMTLAELRRLDAGNGAPIPTFEEVLETVKGRIYLLIEQKGPGTVPSAVAAVRAAGMVDQVAFTSFDLGRIAEARSLGDDLHLAGIFSQLDPAVLPKLVELRADHCDVHYRNLTPELVETIHRHGLKCRGWNPDTLEDIRWTADLGVDSLSSNYPNLIFEALGR